MKFDTKDFEEKMKKSVASYENELKTIRVGRASTAVLDKITVDYFGAPTAINAVAEVKVTDARTIMISPWDSKMLKTIEKAIQASDLGIPPANDGRVLRLNFPPLTEEKRRDVTKQTERMGEDCKVAVRNIRRDALDRAKDQKKRSELTEDEMKAAEKSMQDLTDKYIKGIDAVTEAKKKEVMSI